MPDDSALTAWLGAMGATTQVAANARMSLLEGIPPPPPDFGVFPFHGIPIRQISEPSPAGEMTFPPETMIGRKASEGLTDRVMSDQILEATPSMQVEYLSRMGAPWIEARASSQPGSIEDIEGMRGVIASLHHLTLAENDFLDLHETLMTSLDIEPGDMTPEQRKAWQELLRKMKEEAEQRRREEQEERQRELDRLAEAKRLEELAARRRERLAKRTPEEIEYDEALARWEKARDLAIKKWRKCQDEVAETRTRCLKRAKTDWEECRDGAAQFAIVCALGCAALGGPAAKACIGVCVANWLAARARCDRTYEIAKNRCEEDYNIESDKCSKKYREDRRRGNEDNPVPPKPDSHDY
ncbi:MAG: hypothetical protein KF696_13380 [Planctomycetes bacterium]|nr:hypothetical protein [Planctomycetota bacterium]MCW8135550.1 hypothetical protein [Planctomycetota bacterium]